MKEQVFLYEETQKRYDLMSKAKAFADYCNSAIIPNAIRLELPVDTASVMNYATKGSEYMKAEAIKKAEAETLNMPVSVRNLLAQEAEKNFNAVVGAYQKKACYGVEAFISVEHGKAVYDAAAIQEACKVYLQPQHESIYKGLQKACAMLNEVTGCKSPDMGVLTDSPILCINGVWEVNTIINFDYYMNNGNGNL